MDIKRDVQGGIVMVVESEWLCNTCSKFTEHSDIKKLDTPLSRNTLYEGICQKCRNRNVNSFLTDEPNPIFGKGVIENLIPMQLNGATDNEMRGYLKVYWDKPKGEIE